jgi:transcription initiation factor TFIIIB Brf1 subunit/transcription initiation factor TFIIB
MNVEQLFEIAYSVRSVTDHCEKPRINSQYKCSFCPDDCQISEDGYSTGSLIMNDDGFPTCVTCGITAKEYISDEPEWNTGCNEDGHDPSRVGAPVNTTLFSESWGSGTIMTVKTTGTYANKRLARINFHTSMNHKDRALHHAYEQLDRIGRTKLNLPESVMLQAKIMYKKFSESVLTRGAIRNGIKANCIIRACQDANIARTTQEISEVFEIPAKDISRTADLFRETIPSVETSTTKSSDLIARIFNQVIVPDNVRGRIRQKCIRMCSEIEKHPTLMGKTPKGIAAAVLYISLEEYKISREDIAKMCEVSLPTLVKLENIVKKILVSIQ